jgi:hypothetical protein
MTRRSLVVTDESARHPFLQSLPPHVRHGQAPVRARKRWAISAHDWRDFFLSYCACFVAVSTYIA